MVRENKTRKKRVVLTRGEADTASDFTKQLLKCKGDICFEEGADGIPTVTVNREASPECAEAIAKNILQGRGVRFEIVGKPILKVKDKD